MYRYAFVLSVLRGSACKTRQMYMMHFEIAIFYTVKYTQVAMR